MGFFPRCSGAAYEKFARQNLGISLAGETIGGLITGVGTIKTGRKVIDLYRLGRETEIAYLPEIIISAICKCKGIKASEILGDLDKTVENIINKALKNVIF